MKQRFVRTKVNSPIRNTLISIGIFVLIFFCFRLGINTVSDKTNAQEKSTLEAAISRQVIHCYAIEGAYPPSLAYLRENYGLIYDEDRFFIDYQTQGSNILPDVTIIDKEDSK